MDTHLKSAFINVKKKKSFIRNLTDFDLKCVHMKSIKLLKEKALNESTSSYYYKYYYCYLYGVVGGSFKKKIKKLIKSQINYKVQNLNNRLISWSRKRIVSEAY